MERYSLTSSLRPIKHQKDFCYKHTYSYSQHDPQQQSLSIQGKSPKIISFVGKISSNINQILSTIKCCPACQRQFKEVLQIFASKVQKLRADRDKLRQKYIEDIYQLQCKVKQLQNQNKQLINKLQKISQQYSPHNPEDRLYKQMRKNFSNTKSITFNFDEECIRQQQSLQQLQHLYNAEMQKTIHQAPLQKSIKQQSTFDNILRMAVKYNLSSEELENLIKQYLSAEAQLISNDKQIKKLKKLQQELQKQRKKKQIRSEVETFLKPSGRKNTINK